MNLSYEDGVTVLRAVCTIIFFVIKTTKQDPAWLYFDKEKQLNSMRPHMSHSLVWTNFGMATIQTLLSLPVLALPTNWYGYKPNTQTLPMYWHHPGPGV
jgi:hypothetical protein